MATIGVSVGRVRVTSAISPGEPGYIRSMRLQMEHITSQLNLAASKVKFVTAKGMLYALEPIMELSQELVPVDTGRLKRSAFSEVVKISKGFRASIGYARYGQPKYAAFVHEMVHIPHNRPAKAQAKFLEAAVQQRIGHFERRLFYYVKEQMGFK